MIDEAWLYEWELRHVHHRSDEDVPFYAAVAAATPGPFLEVACGTGRVGARLAAAGIDVTGLDLDERMLAVARRRRPEATWIRADMRDFDLGRRFAVVAVPYNSIQLLDDAGRAAALAHIAGHLADGGRVALEVTDFLAGAHVLRVSLTRTAAAEGVEAWGALEHDPHRRTTTYHRELVVAGRRVVSHVVLRSLDEAELRRDLDAVGLAVERVERDGYRLRVVALRALRAGDADRRDPPPASTSATGTS